MTKTKHTKQIEREILQAEQEYNVFLQTVLKEWDISNYKRVIMVGTYIQKQGLVAVDRICGKLKKDLKGRIDRNTIWVVCQNEKPQWLNQTMKGKHKGANQWTSSISASVTDYQKQVAEALKKNRKRTQILFDFKEEFTGLAFDEIVKIHVETPKGQNANENIADASQDNMFKLAKQMDDTEINFTLKELREHQYIASQFSTVLLEERQSRERNSHLLTK